MAVCVEELHFTVEHADDWSAVLWSSVLCQYYNEYLLISGSVSVMNRVSAGGCTVPHDIPSPCGIS